MMVIKVTECSEIAEGMNNASSALATAGNTFEQSVALLTAANTTVQNISKASTGLRTITSRLRNTTVDLEELGEEMTESKYEELVSTLTKAGVALRDMNGEYRSTYDIMKDLAAVWDNLTSMQQSALMTAIAGNRQQNIMASLLTNFKEASGAMDAMNKSTGALAAAYGTHMDTIQGHIDKLSAAFQDLSQHALNSGVFKGMVDFARVIVNIVDAFARFHQVLPVAIFITWTRSILNSRREVTLLTNKMLTQKAVTEQDRIAVDNLRNSQRQWIVTQVRAAQASGRLTQAEADQLLTQLGLTSAEIAGKSATDGLSMSFRGLGAAIKANPIGFILSILTEIIGLIQIFSDKAEEARQKRIQGNQEILNTEDALAKEKLELLNNAQVIESYMKASKLTEAQESAFETAVDAVSGALGGKKIALNDTKAAQDGYLDSLKAITKEEREQAIIHARNAAQAAKNKLKDSATQDTASYRYDAAKWFSDDEAGEIARRYTFGYNNYWKKDGNRYVTNTPSAIEGYRLRPSDYDNPDEVLNYYTALIRARDELAKQNLTDTYQYEAISSALSGIASDAEDAINAIAQLQLLEHPVPVDITNKDDYKAYIDDLIDKSDEFKGKSIYYVQAVKDALYAMGDYPAVAKDMANATDEAIKPFSELKEELDKARSAFSTVASAIKEYNDNGAMSSDTLSKLLSLEPEYLNLLVDENGQLSLNSESYEKLVKAKLENMLVSQMQSAFDSILKMSVEEAAAYAAAEAYDAETGSVLNLIKAKMQLAMADAATKDNANNTDVYTKAILRAGQSFAPLVEMIDNYTIAADNATSSTNSSTDALKEQKEALEASKEALSEYKDELTDAQSAIKELIDLASEYIKQQKNDEKTALEERKKNFDDLIDKEKEELQLKKEAAEFEKTLKQKQNAVAKNALAASVASLDDSAAGRKAQKEANDNLVSSRDDLYDTLADHEYDIRVKALEQLKEKNDEYYDNAIKKIDEYLSDARRIYEDACALIENDTGDLYGKLWDYTYQHTTKTKAEFDHMWSAAQTALEKYGVAQYGVIGVLEILQSQIYDTEIQISHLEGAIKNVSDSINRMANESLSNVAQKISNIRQEYADLMSWLGSNKWVFRWKDVYGNDQTKYSIFEDQGAAINDILNQLGWDSRGGSFVKQNMQHLASGTLSARGGLSEVNEDGHEIRVLNKGDGILTSKITRNLSNLGSNPVQFLADAGKELLSKISNSGIMGGLFGVTPTAAAVGVGSSGDMPITIVNHINGDVNPSTLKALEKAQKQITNDAINGVFKKTLGLRNSSRVR